MYINEKGREQYHQSGPARSYRNEDQAKLVLQLVLGIVNAHNSVTSDDIGIITPYAAQVGTASRNTHIDVCLNHVHMLIASRQSMLQDCKLICYMMHI